MSDLFGDRDGDTYEREFDYDRLNRQAKAVFDLMSDGAWRSLRGISTILGEPEASVSARLRDFRKERFGGFTVERERHPSRKGQFMYRMIREEIKARLSDG